MVARRKRIVAETDNSDWQAPKKRKPRKRMSEEQRVAAAARLEKAREKRKAKDPDYGMSGIHESLRNLPNDHPLHPDKVKKYLVFHDTDIKNVGVRKAIVEFLNEDIFNEHNKSQWWNEQKKSNQDWKLIYHTNDSEGLTILERQQ